MKKAIAFAVVAGFIATLVTVYRADAISAFSYNWTINTNGDTATVTKWKANNDSVLYWAGRICDTINKSVPRWGTLRSRDSVWAYLPADTIDANVADIGWFDTVKTPYAEIDSIASVTTNELTADSINVRALSTVRVDSIYTTGGIKAKGYQFTGNGAFTPYSIIASDTMTFALGQSHSIKRMLDTDYVAGVGTQPYASARYGNLYGTLDMIAVWSPDLPDSTIVWAGSAVMNGGAGVAFARVDTLAVSSSVSSAIRVPYGWFCTDSAFQGENAVKPFAVYRTGYNGGSSMDWRIRLNPAGGLGATRTGVWRIILRFFGVRSK